MIIRSHIIDVIHPVVQHWPTLSYEVGLLGFTTELQLSAPLRCRMHSHRKEGQRNKERQDLQRCKQRIMHTPICKETLGMPETSNTLNIPIAQPFICSLRLVSISMLSSVDLVADSNVWTLLMKYTWSGGFKLLSLPSSNTVDMLGQSLLPAMLDLAWQGSNKNAWRQAEFLWWLHVIQQWTRRQTMKANSTQMVKAQKAMDVFDGGNAWTVKYLHRVRNRS